MDEWDYFNALFYDADFIKKFTWQHGPHRMGIGFFLMEWIMDLTAWDSRALAYSASFLLIFASLTGNFIKYRLIGRFDYFDVIIPLIFLNLNQYEILILVQNLSLNSLPLVLIMSIGAACLIKQYYVKYPLILILNIFTIFTGFSIFMGLVIPVFLFVESIKLYREKSKFFYAHLLWLVISLLSMASFFIDYTIMPTLSTFPIDNPIEYIYFINGLLINFLGVDLHDPNYFYATLLILMIYPALVTILIKSIRFFIQMPVKNTKDYELNSISIIFLLFVGLFAVNCAIGRTIFGVEASGSSRYVTFISPLYFILFIYPNYYLKKQKLYIYMSVFVLVMLYGTYKSHNRNQPAIKYFTLGLKEWKECYFQHEDASFCNEKTNFSLHPDPDASKIDEKMDYLRRNKLNLYKEE